MIDYELPFSDKTKRQVRAIPLLLAIAGAVLVGIALTLQFNAWSAIVTEAGGGCGSSHGISHGPCPRGTTWILPISIIALVGLVPLTLISARRAIPGRAGYLGVVVLIGIGVIPGLTIFHWAHGNTLKTVWTAAPDRPATARGLGAWQAGNTFVRARDDRLVGYDSANGNKRWTYTLPGRDVLCGMSPTTAGGVGLVAHGVDAEPCDQLTAVDLGTGKALWQRTMPGAQETASFPAADIVAVTGDTAIMQLPQTIAAVGLRDGRPRWESKASGVCRFSHVVAGTDQVLTEENCAAPRIRALDPATGRTRWDVPANIQSTSANLTLLSATPAVVQVNETGRRGKNVIASLDGQGRTRAEIPVGDDDRQLDVSTHGFDATPARRVFVQDDLLVAEARRPNGKESVLAYGLGDGRLRWSTGVADTAGMQVTHGQALVIEDDPRSPGVWSIALADGRQTYLGVTGFHWVLSHLALYPSGGRILVAVESATSPGSFPAAAIAAR